MAMLCRSTSSSLLLPSLLLLPSRSPLPYRRRWYRAPSMADAASRQQASPELVTFLGKGGSRKTSATVLAAQVPQQHSSLKKIGSLHGLNRIDLVGV